MRALAALVLAPAFALGIVSVAVGMVGGVAREPAKPNSIVWSQRVFTSQAGLEAWLEARGSSYETWAERHPSLAEVFETQTAAASPVAAETRTHRRDALLAPLVAAVALLVVFAVALPRLRYRRRPRAVMRRRHREVRPRKPLRVRETAIPALAAVRASASSVAQAGRAHSPQLRSVVRMGMESIVDMHYALSSPHARRKIRGVVLYAACAVFAVALGASVAIYFP
jgi:hypothetical protein